MSRQLDEQKRENILNAAFDTFGELGYEATKIKHIADKAGVAPGTVYTYFDNKEDLFRITVNRNWQLFREELHNAVLSHSSYHERLIRLINFGFDLLKQVHPILYGMFDYANRLCAIGDNIRELSEIITKLLLEGSQKQILSFPLADLNMEPSVRIFISGIFFQMTIIPPEEIDKEIEIIKQNITMGLNARGLEVEV